MGARIIVMGCYATRDARAVAALPGVSDVVTDKRELPDLLGRFGVVDVPSGISGFGARHRAFVKVQDGCLLRCSYCVIPHVRPHAISRPLNEVVDEVKRLIDNDYREIVLAGIHLGHYGVDVNRFRPKKEWVRLSHLVRRLAVLDGDFRVRLSSIEATEVTRELLDVMRQHSRRICPHLHISMQSGSDRVLRRMRRRWGAKRFSDRCRLVRETLDRPALTTDVMVGFPGETDEDFEQTCQVLRAVGFSKLHVFPFSARPGTPAADMPDHVPSPVKTERAQKLAEMERELRRRYFTSLMGARLTVLAESLSAGRRGEVHGTSCRYAPVTLPGDEAVLGHLVDVTAGDASSDGILSA
jgi:threonylcarbamoyladenosine tRNA methylthiotransferase MtaB